MSSLHTPEAKLAITTLIGAIEKETAAEIVVTLRARSGSYRAADLMFGAFAALGLLCLFLYHPEEFDFTFFPLEQAAAFGLGTLLSTYCPPLRRLFTRRGTREANVLRDARGAFLDQGIDKTRDRTGILVFLSRLEKRAELVCDRGIDQGALEKELSTAQTALSSALAQDNLESAVTALTTLGTALAKTHPVREDDIDELSNEVAA